MPYITTDGGAVVWEDDAPPPDDIQIEHPVVRELVLDDEAAPTPPPKPKATRKS